jgi:flagellar basal body-associated protein FliL
MAKKVKVENKKKSEQKKSQTLMLVLFFILIGVIGVLFYYLYLKPPTQKEGTQPGTNITATILKNYNIDNLREDLNKRKLTIPSIETKEDEIGKVDPFIP